MPYIACPACTWRIDISRISFRVDTEARLCDRVESDDKNIWCPLCKEKYTISIRFNFSDRVTIASEDCTYHDDSLDINWSLGIRGRGGEFALEYYDEDDE